MIFASFLSLTPYSLSVSLTWWNHVFSSKPRKISPQKSSTSSGGQDIQNYKKLLNIDPSSDCFLYACQIWPQYDHWESLKIGSALYTGHTVGEMGSSDLLYQLLQAPKMVVWQKKLYTTVEKTRQHNVFIEVVIHQMRLEIVRLLGPEPDIEIVNIWAFFKAWKNS